VKQRSSTDYVVKLLQRSRYQWPGG